MRCAVERERAALEWLEEMICSERKLLNSCGSRSSVSPVSVLTVQEEEQEQGREMEVILRSESLWSGHTGTIKEKSWGTGAVSELPRPSEEERKRRAAEKRAAFLASAASLRLPTQISQITAHPARGGGLVRQGHPTIASDVRLPEATSSIRSDLFTVGADLNGLNVNGLNISACVDREDKRSEQERKQRAQEKRSAFMDMKGGNKCCIMQQSGSENVNERVGLAEKERETRAPPNVSSASPTASASSPMLSEFATARVQLAAACASRIRNVSPDSLLPSVLRSPVIKSDSPSLLLVRSAMRNFSPQSPFVGGENLSP